MFTFIAFYRSKQIEVQALTSYEAQKASVSGRETSITTPSF